MAETTAPLPAVGLPTASKVLCAVYAAIAIAALVATWRQNAAYFDRGASFLVPFLNDSRVTPASRSLTADILLFFLSAAVLMVIEARKHGVRFVWLHIVAGVSIAISVAFPLFGDRPRTSHRQDRAVATGHRRHRWARRIRRRGRGPHGLGGRGMSRPAGV